MDKSKDTNSNKEGQEDPYSILGLNKDASFEAIQKARKKLLVEVGEDPLAKAKIEASYDSLLMGSLKARQLGEVSNEALSASQREVQKSEGGSIGRSSLLTRLKEFNSTNKEGSVKNYLPNLELPENQGLTIRILVGILAIILILTSPNESIDLILSCSTIGVVISQIRRGRSALSSLGWSVVLLSIGLIIGGLISNGSSIDSSYLHAFTPERLKALPAVLLLWIGSLLLA